MPHRIPTYRPFAHSQAKRLDDAAKQREYDQARRNKESKRIYNTDAWQRARLIQLREHPLCYDCLQAGRHTVATQVHHIEELTAAPELALDLDNLRSLCLSCHMSLHRRATRPSPRSNP